MKTKLVPQEVIQNKIVIIRGKKVMFDRDLARLYEVTTGNLNKAVKRNIERFPTDFMFQLTKKQFTALRFQFGSLKCGHHLKYRPFAFTSRNPSRGIKPAQAITALTQRNGRTVQTRYGVKKGGEGKFEIVLQMSRATNILHQTSIK